MTNDPKHNFVFLCVGNVLSLLSALISFMMMWQGDGRGGAGVAMGMMGIGLFVVGCLVVIGLLIIALVRSERPWWAFFTPFIFPVAYVLLLIHWPW